MSVLYLLNIKKVIKFFTNVYCDNVKTHTRNERNNPVKVSSERSTISRVDGQWFDKFIHLHRGKTRAQKAANRISCQS